MILFSTNTTIARSSRILVRTAAIGLIVMLHVERPLSLRDKGHEDQMIVSNLLWQTSSIQDSHCTPS